MSKEDLRDLCNNIGISCKNASGKYLSKAHMIEAISHGN
jgi:hypothetical protein